MKRPLTRLLAALLAAALLCGCAGLSGLGGAGEELPEGSSAPENSVEAPREPATLRVAYDAAENLNPYTTGSLQNYYLAQLLYDPLFRLDDSYNTESCLAQSMSMAMEVHEGYETALVTIRLRAGVEFWDGSALTAEDVVYSLGMAMQSSYYSAGLSHISWAEADPEDPLQLTLGLSRPDAFFEKSLTFPIVKRGTGENDRPVGCGRFTPENRESFVPNSDHHDPVENIAEIQLVDIPDLSSVGYSIKTGMIDLAVSDLRTPWNRSLGIGYTTMQLSNMVYLGVNKGSSALSDQNLRQAIYRLLDRSELDSGIYLGEDTTSWMPFNPSMEEIAGSPSTLPSQLSTAEAGQLLDSIGYEQRNQNGYRTRNGAALSFTILVNEENTERVALAEKVAQSLETVGLRAGVEKCSFEQYRYRVAEGGYDLFVGEVKLPCNLNILSMLGGADETGSGAWASEEVQAAVRQFLRTGRDYDQAVQLFAQEVPFVPLFFRQGIVAYPLNFCSNIIATEQDIFYNIKDWIIS